GVASVLDWIIVRAVLLFILTIASYFMHPFGLGGGAAALAGLGFGFAILVFERRLRDTSLKRLIGAAIGSVLGIVGAYLISLVLSLSTTLPKNDVSFIQIAVLLLMAYV